MCSTPKVQVTPSTKSRAMAPRAQDLPSDQKQLAEKIPVCLTMLNHPSSDLLLRCIFDLPDVFVVAGFGFFHSSVSVHFVDDHSERQEINLQM